MLLMPTCSLRLQPSHSPFAQASRLTHLLDGTLVNSSTLVDQVTGSGGLSTVSLKGRGGRRREVSRLVRGGGKGGRKDKMLRVRVQDTYESTSVSRESTSDMRKK